MTIAEMTRTQIQILADVDRMLALMPDLVALAYQYRDDLRHGLLEDARGRRLDRVLTVLERVEQEHTRYCKVCG